MDEIKSTNPVPQAQPEPQPQPQSQPKNPPMSPVPVPKAVMPASGMTTGDKVCWFFIGMLLQIPGVLLAQVIGNNRNEAYRKEALRMTLIGWLIPLAIALILGTIAGCTALLGLSSLMGAASGQFGSY